MQRDEHDYVHCISIQPNACGESYWGIVGRRMLLTFGEMHST